MPLLTAAIPGLNYISKVFAIILNFFNGFTHNYALSIILLTIAFRIIVLPLSIKQTKSMVAMQRLQPQLKEIQKKYKDDREKQGQEMMKLYKENKVNPLGGCLPLLIQLPILFALFDVLHNPAAYFNTADFFQKATNFFYHPAVPKKAAAFYTAGGDTLYQYSRYLTVNLNFMGVKNILAPGSMMWSGGSPSFVNATSGHTVATNQAVSKTAPILLGVHGGEYVAVIILILLTIVTGYISSKMMTSDPKQAKWMAFMPVIFGVFAWILPAGVTIYILVTNVATIAQQWVQLEREGFFKDKRERLAKEGKPTGFVEKWKPRVQELPSKALGFLGLRSADQDKKKPQGKGTPTKDKKPATGQKKQGEKPKAARKPSGKGTGKPDARKDDVVAKKAQEGEPSKKPAGKKTENGEGVSREGGPSKKSVSEEAGPEDSGKKEQKPGSAGKGTSRDYPAKKKK